ncbi:hypothetical protein HY311_02965 [Candidatus Nomurabacteria bacterium]|nr:hypothetical protein [Candidatus Nomurabacteria bacterium]
MKNVTKNINNKEEGGFITIIILIIVALLIMKYYGITVTGVFNWFVSFFRSVLR